MHTQNVQVIKELIVFVSIILIFPPSEISLTLLAKKLIVRVFLTKLLILFCMINLVLINKNHNDKCFA